LAWVGVKEAEQVLHNGVQIWCPSSLDGVLHLSVLQDTVFRSCCPAHVQLNLTATASAWGVLVLVLRAQARAVAFPAVDAFNCFTALIKDSMVAARILFSNLATVNANSARLIICTILMDISFCQMSRTASVREFYKFY